MARISTLERLGWKFVRVRGSRFYRDPEGAMAPVFERLKELGVDARLEGQAVPGKEGVEQGEELKERVIRRAAQLQDEWAAKIVEKP